MGGLAGHMMHLHDNNKLTIGSFKQIISDSVSGKVAFKEKLDGFNIHLIKVNGEMRFARNGKDLMAGGFTSEQMSERFANERIRSIFREAYELVMSNKRLLDSMLDWCESYTSYNCEIISGKANVINYPGIKRLIIHNCHEWEYSVEKVRFVFSRVVAADVPAAFELGILDYTPSYINVDAVNKKVASVFEKYGLSDDCTLNQYYELRFLALIASSYPELLGSPAVIRELYERIINKTIHINLRELRKMTNVDLSVILNTSTVRDIFYLVRKELDELVLKVGTLILGNVHCYMNEAMKYSVTGELFNEIPEELDAKSKARWAACDKMIFALEGVVFEYDGNLYKWTGPFAPINQILGGER